MTIVIVLCSFDNIYAQKHQKFKVGDFTYEVVNESARYVQLTKCKNKKITSANIPERITVQESKKVTTEYEVIGIEQSAFYDCKKLQTVVVPNTIKYYGDNCFHGCSSLISITLSDYFCAHFGRNVFAYCKSLKEIDLKRAGGKIDGCFKGCSSLKTITIPEHVSEIGGYTFNDCDNLETIIFENPNIEFINPIENFEGPNLKQIIVKDGNRKTKYYSQDGKLYMMEGIKSYLKAVPKCLR